MKLLDLSALLLFVTVVALIIYTFVFDSQILAAIASQEAFTDSQSSVSNPFGGTLYVFIVVCIGHVLCKFTNWNSTTSCVFAILVALTVLGLGIFTAVTSIITISDVSILDKVLSTYTSISDSDRKRLDTGIYVLASIGLSVGLCAVFYGALLINSRIKKFKK
tara:strand:- start:773 stop:1261 length:489 start_codon:yes stop_codon:yes gene_type:complete